jgi:peptidoglycan/xylan/chitin deacetylase (PgdA/CDA1 family)
MTYQQIAGRVRVPEGKKVAVNIGLDFDAMSIWDGSWHRLSPAYLSRGEFGAEVAAQRLLKLFDKHHIKTNWFIPGHTVDTFTDPCKDVIAAGHEVGHHGYGHENPAEVDRETERAVLQRGLEALDRIGVRPQGYRSAYWDFSPNTLELLEEFGFKWDSSLMANDLHPYYPRLWTRTSTVKHGEHQVASGPSVPGEPSKIMEIPPSWYLDDFPQVEFVMGAQEGMAGTVHIEDRWRDIFDYAAHEEDGCCYALTLHPQSSGRAHIIMMLERLIEYFKDHGGAFMTMSEIAAATEFPEGARARTAAVAASVSGQ